MKCPFRLVYALTGLVVLWTSPSHAITLHVSDDQSVRIDRTTSSPRQHRHSPRKSRQNFSISIQKLHDGHEDQGFVKFDLSPLPPDSQIERATLRLWPNKVKKAGTLRLHEVLADWHEDTIRWRQLPPTTPAFDSLPINKNDKKQFLTIDVTTIVQGWIDNPPMNFGLALVSDQTDPLKIKLDSKENQNTSHPMEIEVTLLPGLGSEGPPGIQGPPGATGEPGLPGEQGPPGETGKQGIQGIPGPPGPTGSDGNLGSPGQNGTTWFTGTELPTEDQGAVGDLYLHNDTGQYFTKTDSTTWTPIGNLQGPQGVEGQTGSQGDPGPQGLQGNPGPTGTQGTQGPSGPTGPPGATPLLLMVGQNCPTGEFLTGFDAVGNILCGPPPASTDPSPPTAIHDADPGDVIITEIMINPSAVTDSNGEWFELFNTRSETVDIRGWRIEDESGNTHSFPDTDPILIPAGAFLVFGKNSDFSSNGGIIVAHAYNAITLNNGGDTLLVFDVSGEEIDRVDYGTGSFSVPEGASLNLDPMHFDLNDNDSGANWCASTTAIGTDLDLGTPGAANETCPL